MADIADVEAAIVGLAAGSLYPNGSNGFSITGKPVRLYRGWPLTSALSVDLAAGIANVSVFSVAGTARNTTRWNAVPVVVGGEPTLAVSVSGNSATFSGVAGPGQVAGVLVANQPFVYRSKPGDTPAVVAAVLAQQVRVVRSCWLSGTTVSVPGLTGMIARTAADGSTLTEVARQEQSFRLSCWCPDPGSRDFICRTLTAAFAASGFLALADDTSGRIRYRSTTSFDEAQDAQLYRRDLVYDVEYGTTVLQTSPSMLFGDLHLLGEDLYG